jgi:hypothetical protein
MLHTPATDATTTTKRTRRRRGGRGLKKSPHEAKKEGDAVAAGEKKEEWTMITRGGARKTLPTAPSIPPEGADEQGDRVHFFALSSPNEGGFIVGAGGRNTALIFKTTGVSVLVETEGSVTGFPRRADADVPCARRMALAMAAGGVVRWFVTPLATERGFPPDNQPLLRGLANTYGCELQLLQSKEAGAQVPASGAHSVEYYYFRRR